jgi:hypothetical protein
MGKPDDDKLRFPIGRQIADSIAAGMSAEGKIPPAPVVTVPGLQPLFTA